MRYWALVVSGETYQRESLYAFDTLDAFDTLAPPEGAPAIEPGDQVALLVDGRPPRLFGLGRMRSTQSGIGYTHRLFDAPLPVTRELPLGLSPLGADDYDGLTGGVGADRRTDADKSEWNVCVALPIEAASPAEAVREFWTYMAKLGPRELPAFVWPRGDELAMQAYVLGQEAALDPEDD